MDEIMLLTCMGMFTLLAGVCSIVFNRIRLPPLIGYLMAGILIANFWNVGEDGHMVVDILSDIGLVMLMFCIGLEVNLKKIRRQGIFAMKVAAIQLPLMVIGGIVGGGLLGFNMIQCIALGCIISGSSTAVVMAVLKSNGKLDKEHIDLLVLITIMEDIGQVIMLSILTPILAGSSMGTQELVVMIVSIVAFMVASLFIGLRLIPRLVNWISDNVALEVLVIFSVGLAFGMAFLSVQVGLSMAIGAFLMGMMMSACKKGKEINHQIEPMKNMFMAMFFISVGMEIHIDVILDNIPLILIIYLIFAVLKWSTVSLGFWVCDADSKVGFMSAISLIAMGEFAFIIAKEAYDYGVFTDSMYTSVIGAALVSMIVLPFLTGSANRIWAAGTNHMPAPIKRFGAVLSSTRDDIFEGVNNSSRMTKKAYSKGITHAYFNLVIIAVIEVAFYWLFDTAAEWLWDVFGGDLIWWEISLLALNLFILIPPTTRFIVNAKAVSGLILHSCCQISKVRGRDRSSSFFNSLYKLNTIVVTLAIDFLIILIVPNPLGLIERLICLVVAVLLTALVVRKARKDAKESILDTICVVNNDDAEDDGQETCPLPDAGAVAREQDPVTEAEEEPVEKEE